MPNNLSVNVIFNNRNYNLTYNEQSGYYEGMIEAPSEGGVYEANVSFRDVLNNEFHQNQNIRILQQEKVDIKENKNFLWLFDFQTFEVKDIVEIASYEIIIDEETNENSTIKILKETTAKAGDIVAVKRNNKVVYWGIIQEIQNENGKATFVFVCKYITNMFDRKVELQNENIIKDVGIEDFIKQTIIDNFTASDDTFLNLDYLVVENTTSTPKIVSVSNVDNGIYNLHTWMTNCNQNYGITYDFKIQTINDEIKLVLTIAIEEEEQKLIDVKAMNIINYQEIFETDIVAKVVVLTSTNPYYLFLKTDRTTTTNMNDPNRAKGKVETIYVENYDEAPQEALNIMKGNTYNHNISFSLDEIIGIGTPIAIKTNKSLIYNTYISSIKVTSNKFIDYQCGNIRINFIEKLLKERNK